MTKILILSLIALSPNLSAFASESYVCTSDVKNSVIPTYVQVNVQGNEVSGKLNFNFGSASRTLATFGVDREKNDFALIFADLSSSQKTVSFRQDGYDHFSYTLNFNDKAGTLTQVMQLDCSDEVTSQVFMTCAKTVQAE
ncbi:MAG: hypothetical protein H7333_12275 [Bdellovibrionales bacterium]|nr:hypothetical protein [Oligoflexia bacterium]